MNLNIFFDSIDEDSFEHIQNHASFYRSISCNTGIFPEWQTADIALIGLPTTIVDQESILPENIDGAGQIRQKLYQLYKGNGAYHIVDLGDLRPGVNAEESALRLKEVCATLLQHQTIPLIFGGPHEMTLGQYLAFEDMSYRVGLLNVDARIDMQHDEDNEAGKNHIYKIISEHSAMLYHYSHLAYQSFLTDQQTLAVLEKLHFDLMRLGSLRENMLAAEPLVRDAHMMSFDITAIRMGDAPGNTDAQPFGLTGEEACQLCWYAGASTRMQSVGIYGYNPVMDNRYQTAAVVATMLWYFVEGFYFRKHEPDFNSTAYDKYTVAIGNDASNLVFYRSKMTDKWWIEVPPKPYMLPCSYADYIQATEGEIPNRWIYAQARLL